MKKMFFEENIEAGSGTLEGYIVSTKQENWKNFLQQEVPDIAAKVIQAIEKSGVLEFAVLKTMHVDEGCRGYGLGSALMNSVFEESFDAAILVADLREEQSRGFNLVAWYESYDFVAVPSVSDDVRLMGYGDKVDWASLIPRAKSKL